MKMKRQQAIVGAHRGAPIHSRLAELFGVGRKSKPTGAQRCALTILIFQLCIPINGVNKALPGRFHFKRSFQHQGRAAPPLGFGRLDEQLHARFIGQPVGFLEIAGNAGRDDIGPIGFPPAGLGQDVFQVQLVGAEFVAAVAAVETVMLVDVAPGKLDVAHR